MKKRNQQCASFFPERISKNDNIFNLNFDVAMQDFCLVLHPSAFMFVELRVVIRRIIMMMVINNNYFIIAIIANNIFLPYGALPHLTSFCAVNVITLLEFSQKQNKEQAENKGKRAASDQSAMISEQKKKKVKRV